MNEQQLQQILINAQQAIAAAATAAVINSLLNPQQAGANLLNTNALTDPTSNDLQHQQQPDSHQQSPVATSSPSNPLDGANGIQELLLRLQQQAAAASAGGGNGGISQATAAALNLNLNNQLPIQPNPGGSPISQSPVSSRLLSQQSSSNNIQQSNQITPNKKLKRHYQSPSQQFPQQNRPSLEPTSKPQHSTPKSHSLSNLGNRNNNSSNTNTSSSSSSSAFLTNNVGLPRKLVRGQDVWLGRGAEQTRQILKCMWCGQSFRTLAEMTQHMKETQHYTNIISQEQITSWRQPEGSDSRSSRPAGHHARSIDDNHDDLSDRFNDSDRDESFSNDDEAPQHQQPPKNTKSRAKTSTAIKRELTPAKDNLSTTGSVRDETSPSILSKEPSQQQQQQSSTPKPHTRSRRRENVEENETSNPASEDCRENSPASESSSSQQRLNISVLGDHNEHTEPNKEASQLTDENTQEASKVADNSDNEQPNEIENDSKGSVKDEDAKELKKDVNCGEKDNHEKATEKASSDKEDEEEDAMKEECLSDADILRKEDDNVADSNSRDQNKDNEDQDNSDIVLRKRPKRKHPDADPIIASAGSNSDPSMGLDSSDPLSALATMVEKEFDPRQRPGVANGGILQRLGIDEEVSPPWQLNFQNWWTAAAYGHPMVATLLAASMNPNGIKMSKSVTPRKEDD